jgi:hypothetical protein
VVLDQVIAAWWNTDYLYNRIPHHYAWVFSCGVLTGCANDLRSRALAMAVVAIAAWLAWGFTSASYFVAGGVALVLFVPVLVVPASIKLLVGELAAASMFIYLSHFQVGGLLQHRAGAHGAYIALGAAVVVGVVFARVYGWLERRAQEILAARNRNLPVSDGAHTAR